MRLVVDGLPACRDSTVFIKDLHFDEVPVRIYLPRVPSASKRRGVIFFHGGCGIFGSISKELKEKIRLFRIVNYVILKTLLSLRSD